jgi:diguanylate cyclase (GGDEF)-like protein
MSSKRSPIDPLAFRQSLLELLETDPPNEEKLLAEFERRQEDGGPLYSSILYILTHLTFSESEARRHWRRIRAHRERLRLVVARDVGLRVALLDYFSNVNRELKNPKVIEISIYERTERSAISDGLTGLYNHAYFVAALKREAQRCRRHDLQMSLAMFDLDDFKKINDTRGHLEGDKVLMKAAALVREALREIDVAARYGGEEFAVILPDTPKQGATIVAERIRARIAEHFKRRRGGLPVTVSGGVASFPGDADTFEELIKKADVALYRSKAGGKNRIVVAAAERRRHERIPADQAVTFRSATGEPARARAKNVSRGGLLVTLERRVPVGSAVSVVIRPRGEQPMALRGEVVRVERAGKRRAFEVAVRLVRAGGQPLVLLRGASAEA